MTTLESVIANDELARRRPRRRRQAELDAALDSLAAELASSARQILQKLSDVALALCQAHSAGVSLLEREGERRFFRWHAVSGRWAPLLWTTLPREFSPCGTVLDRRAAQLMILPERHFTPLAQVPPKVHEALLVPFEVSGELRGTVWVISHDAHRRFDSEDRRVVGALAGFAARAYDRLSSLSADDVAQLARLNVGRSLNPVGRSLNPPSRATVQKRILVVDDNADAADALAGLLRAMGHEVRIARNGAAALAGLATPPEIVLLDIVMPDMTGYEVARRIRERLGRRVRLVALSGFHADYDVDGVFDHHVVKPVDPGFLRSLLG